MALREEFVAGLSFYYFFDIALVIPISRVDAVNMKDLAGALTIIFRELQSGHVQPLLHRGNTTLLGRLAFECLKKNRSSLVKGGEADTTELKALLSTVGRSFTRIHVCVCLNLS
jgi:hypothetical protein